MAAQNWRITLNVDLFPPSDSLPNDVKEAIIANIWLPNATPTNLYDIEAFDAYFAYYREQFRSQSASNHAAETHADIVDIAKEILTNTSASMIDLYAHIQEAYPRFGSDIPKLSNSIELTARLTLMVNVVNQIPNGIYTLQTAISWPKTSSLIDVVGRLIKTSTPAPVTIRRISRNVNVYELQRIGGFQFAWTDNLSDHLVLDGNTVYMYYHASVLYRMQDSQVGVESLWNKEFFQETLDTLALIIPDTHDGCRSWLRKVRERRRLDPRITRLHDAPRDVDHYSYWRDRLLIICEAFEQSQPSTLSQWWFDRRNKVQWYTFWVAIIVLILTLVFGLISSVTGIVQSWAAVKSVKLAGG